MKDPGGGVCVRARMSGWDEGLWGRNGQTHGALWANGDSCQTELWDIRDRCS